MKKKNFLVDMSPEKAISVLESFIRRNDCSMTTDTELVLDPDQTKGFDASEIKFIRMIKHNPQPTKE